MDQILVNKFFEATFQTIYITTIVSIIVFFVGLLLGVLLFATHEEKLINKPTLYMILSQIINILRAIPFIILLIIIMPFTNWLVGSITGPNAAIPALVLSVSPFYARLVENALYDVDKGVLELGFALGFKKEKIIKSIILKEAKPVIIGAFVTMIITIISFSAMAGVIGAGGLGSLAYTYGFQRNNQLITFLATITILLIVYLVQSIGNKYVAQIDHR